MTIAVTNAARRNLHRPLPFSPVRRNSRTVQVPHSGYPFGYFNRWNALFAWLPIESKHQKDYYRAIETATRKADTEPFVRFMLKIILEAVREASTQTPEVTPEVFRLMKSLKGELGRAELMRKLRLKDEKDFRVTCMNPALDAGFTERTIPDKRTCRSQWCRLTGFGIAVLKSRGKQ